MIENGVILQAFHWYIEPGGTFWKEIKNRASEWAQMGITALWLPPACKGQGGGYDVGYGLYDLLDLGEFDQRGTIPTKYGTRIELLEGSALPQQKGWGSCGCGLQPQGRGDEVEEFLAQEVDWNNRNVPRATGSKDSSYTHSPSLPGTPILNEMALVAF
jgi:alpha-amylase